MHWNEEVVGAEGDQCLFARDRRCVAYTASEQLRTEREIRVSMIPYQSTIEKKKTHKRDDLSRLRRELVSELLVIGDQVRNVNVAVILLYQDILPKLISTKPVSKEFCFLVMFPACLFFPATHL